MADKTLVLLLIFCVGFMLSVPHTEGRNMQPGDFSDFGLQAAVAESNAGPPLPATETVVTKPLPKPSCTPSVRRKRRVIGVSHLVRFRDSSALRRWNVAAMSVSIISVAEFEGTHVFRRCRLEPFLHKVYRRSLLNAWMMLGVR